jgi:TonB family protein
MQRRQPDPTLTAVRAVAATDAGSVDLVVLSADETLITTLQEAVGFTNVLHHAPTVDAAVELLVRGHCGILIADLAVLHSDAAQLLERLQSQFPELILLAAGRREEENAVAGLISKGHVYRFLHKPVSPARASLFVSAATRRYHELASGRSPALATVRQLAQPANRSSLLLGIGIAAALALLGTGVLMLRPSSNQPVPTTTISAPTAIPSTPLASDELERAKQAIADGRLAPPAPDNALEHYRAALATEPDNADAKAGVEDVLLRLEEQVTQAIQARDAAGAARILSSLRQAQPDYSQLAPLGEQIAQLSRSLTPSPARKTEAVAATTVRPSLATVATGANIKLARARLATGQLLEPEDDSALKYLREARAQNEDASIVTILATDLGSRLLDQSRTAISAGNAVQARAHYDTAIRLDREFDLALPDLIDVGRQLDEITSAETNRKANQLRELLVPAIKLRESGQLIAPAGNNAYDTVKSLTAQHGDAAEVRAEQQRLVFALLDHARTALAANDLDQADLLAKRAEDLVPGMSATQTLRQQIKTALSQREATTVVSAGTLRRTLEIPAVYPPDAQRRSIEGWVDLEFTVTREGATRDIVVTASEPSRVFDKAASDVLRRWKFEPVIREGAPVDQRARIRMQFSLK